MTTLNVLTRTHRRPKEFAVCLNSILDQTDVRIHHVVSYDYPDDTAYLRSLGVRHYICLAHPAHPEAEFPPNLYLNELIHCAENGYVMYLDDDDMFLYPNAAEVILRYAEDDALLLWKVSIRGDAIPSGCFGDAPKGGDVSGLGFCFHVKHKDKVTWGPTRGADYGVINDLYHKLPRVIWIDAVLTGTQEGNTFHLKPHPIDVFKIVQVDAWPDAKCPPVKTRL